MTEDHTWRSPRLTEDLQFAPAVEQPRYASTTDRPVEYVVVANDAVGVLGFVWACDADDAAGWEARAAAGPDAYNGARPWLMQLRDAKARGLPPSRALIEMAALPGGERTGHVVPGSRARAESLTALREALEAL